MYKISKYKNSSSTAYTMLHVSENEAHDIIQSLSNQLRNNDPNSGRVESQYEVQGSNERGLFSIAVIQPMVCGICREEVPPFTGACPTGKDLLCKDCGEKVKKMQNAPKKLKWNKKNAR